MAGGTSLDIPAIGGVLANDLDGEGDALGATITVPGLFATATLAADGSFTYLPGPDFTNWDSFQYQVDDGQESGNAAIVTIINGQMLDDAGNPHANNEVKHDEHLSLLDLVARHTATHIAVASGNWSEAATWENGLLPVDNANVLIPTDTVVTVDAEFSQTLRTIRVDGTLRFDPSVNTTLRADTTIIDPGGTFEMGTAVEPIDAGVTASLIVADRGPIDRVWDPGAFSRGFISHGRAHLAARRQ